MQIFVPGRLCLFGEHSDWAGGYRRLNLNLSQGYALLVGTNQGIYADVKPHPTDLAIRASLSDGRRIVTTLPMQRELLLQEAQKGDFFSYAAGVAYQFLTYYAVKGLDFDNYFTDLPLQKGLSSSAAICVALARAFNLVYDLKLTRRGEMEFAYLGEITTPSKCGRMDQACAYGNQPILMNFDGDRTDILPLNVSQNLFFAIVDLAANKNTQKILENLHQSYPVAQTELDKNVQKYLGEISSKITQEAAAALQQGDGEKIGKLMTQAQAEFDRYLIPACPDELTAPVLHKILQHAPLQPYIWGGKGVGSQGDGTAQFIVKDEESQEKVIEIIARDFPAMQCLKLTIQKSSQTSIVEQPNRLPLEKTSSLPGEKRSSLPGEKSGQDAHPTRVTVTEATAIEKPVKQKVRKAIIPAAGFGTRMFPMTKVVKKELFPIIDRNGRAKPVILLIVEELVNAGIAEIAIVVSPNERGIFENFFKAPPSPELWAKLSPENRKYSQYLQELGQKITILTQEIQEGYGHAVFCAKDWVKNEPFLLSLGDHVYLSDTKTSCAKQLVEIYAQVNQSVVGLTTMPAEMLQKAGCVTGIWQDFNSILSITQVCEKPDLEYARKQLRVEGMPADEFVCIFGLYVLTAKIFDCLEEDILNNIRFRGEFQLTTCLDKLRQVEGLTGYVIKGKCFDTGLPDAYWQTLMDFRNIS